MTDAQRETLLVPGPVVLSTKCTIAGLLTSSEVGIEGQSSSQAYALNKAQSF